MELRVLNNFLIAAREENITRAAALLHMTQPTLSRQMIQLEEELGVKLFHRSRHRIILTEEGQLLKRRAQEIMDLTLKTEKELSPNQEEISGEVSIGCGETKNLRPLAQAMAAFQEQYPQISFDIYTGVADEVKERMDNGLLDMGLLLEPAEISRYYFVRMPLKERWCVLMRKDSPLAAKERISPEDLSGERIIISKRVSVKNELENWFGPVYGKLKVTATSNLSYNNRGMLVEQGLGVALVHEFDNGFEELCLRPLTPELSNGSVLIWKKDQVMSPAVRAFAAYLKHAFEAVRLLPSPL